MPFFFWGQAVSLFKRSAIVAGLTALIASPGYAVPVSNLITNGNFEDSSPVNLSAYPSSAGGIGQIGQIVNLPGWTKTIIKDPGSNGFAFVVDANADKFDAGSNYPNQGGGFPSTGSPTGTPPGGNGGGPGTNIFVWGPQFNGSGGQGRNIPGPVNNGFQGSPNGGKFVGIDGDYGQSKITQSVSGLDTTKTYTLSFEYAGSQFTDEVGDTNQKWIIDAGTSQFETPAWVNSSQGFTDWQVYTTTFTPSNSTIDLSFTAFGNAVSGSGSLPPFLLMDNVQLLECVDPSSPGCGTPPDPNIGKNAPGPLPIAGVGVAFAWSRRLRRRIQSEV